MQDMKGSLTIDQTVYGGHPVKRQVWTKVEDVVPARARIVQLWDDV